MKKQLLFYLMLFASFATFSQTYPIHDVDDCKLMLNVTNANATYTVSVVNPLPADASVNVSSISASANNGNAQFSLISSIEAGPASTIDWSGRFYSANAGANATGSGRFIVRLLNRTVGGAAGNFVQLALANKTGGAWQTESGSGVVLNPTNAAAINAAGGFNTILILASSNAASIETLFFDNIEFSKNYNLTDDSADLLANNVWIYNNRVGDNKTTPATASNITVDENIATPSTVGNSSPNVLRVTRGSGATTVLQFNHGDINASTAGILKFRVYVSCQTPYTNRIKYYLRKDGDVGNQKVTGDFSLVAGVWNEVSIDLSTMTGTGTVFNNSLFLFDAGIASEADGDIYFMDAIQMPASSSTWDGSTDSDWATATNWTNDVLPNALYNVSIPSGQNPIIGATTGASVNNLTADGAGSLTVNAGGSLIVKGTSTGNVTYNVGVSDTNWHLVSSPVVGETYDNAWVATNSITSGQGNNRAIATYQNGVLDTDTDGAGADTATGPWLYMQDGGSGTFMSGKGYSLKNTSGANYGYTGTYNSDDFVTTIDQNVSNWNLVGNPFSSYIKVGDVISANTANLTDTHEFVYMYNGTSYVALSGTDYVAPGQGFFVNADNSTAGNFTITESLQGHQTGVTFYKNSTPKIKLFLNDGLNTRNTEIEYNVSASASLDRGMDAGTFSGVASGFSIYTHLVSNSEGVDFMRQLLPNNNYENMVVSVGVKAVAGKELTFSADAMNLPTGVKVFLEDRANNTFTELSNNENYKVSTTETLNGIGRFYLHTKSSVLSVDDTILNTVSIYKTNNTTLRVSGLSQGSSTIKLFNILGKEVMIKKFTANNVNDITLPKLATGIYIVQLETATGKLKKKIVLE
jgi:hypothetical protein